MDHNVVVVAAGEVPVEEALLDEEGTGSVLDPRVGVVEVVAVVVAVVVVVRTAKKGGLDRTVGDQVAVRRAAAPVWGRHCTWEWAVELSEVVTTLLVDPTAGVADST